MGKSTWSIAKSLEIQQNDNCEIFTYVLVMTLKYRGLAKQKLISFQKHQV